jgi:hypothetical protein
MLNVFLTHPCATLPFRAILPLSPSEPGGSLSVENVAPIRIFGVPNGCSTVSRRVRIASGFLSRRAASAQLPEHSRRRQIPIAPAALSVPHTPRFRALALFGRRPPQRVDSIVMPASEKPAQIRTNARSQSVTYLIGSAVCASILAVGRGCGPQVPGVLHISG